MESGQALARESDRYNTAPAAEPDQLAVEMETETSCAQPQGYGLGYFEGSLAPPTPLVPFAGFERRPLPPSPLKLSQESNASPAPQAREASVHEQVRQHSLFGKFP